jgi:ribosomal protein L7/L12
MTSNDVYERLGILEQLVQHLYEKTGVPMPDLRALAQIQVSPAVQRLVASGDNIEAIKAYRAETGVDLATAKRIIESL